MTTWKRKSVTALERMLRVRVARPERVQLVVEQEFLKRFFTEFSVDLVFDVGANAGQYAQMLREQIGYRGVIVSFEPLPELAARLKQLAARDPRWLIEQVAVSDSAGQADFNLMANSQFSSLLPPRPSTEGRVDAMNVVTERIPVRTSPLTPYLARYAAETGASRPYLKMDTQGHDLQVAKGLGDSIAQFVGVQTELSFVPLYDGAPRYDDVIAYFEMRGFVLSSIFANNAGHFPDLLEMDCVLYRRDAANKPTSGEDQLRRS